MSHSSAYRHGTTRPNNPSVEAVETASEERRKARQHRKDVRDRRPTEPRLEWDRAPERKTAIAPMLMRAEQIDPSAWLHTLRPKNGQPDMFASFNEYREPGAARLEWYEHAGNWSNRLIHADARRAMASLLEHEHLAGSVQMVYFDPPYGMDFDAKLGNDTLTRRAFIDTYDRGVHSYLDAVRDTAALVRELLTESGSFFMQIGDVNVHRCAMVLDDVFGPENRVTTISYATGGGGSSTSSLSKAMDYILWYAKDREQMRSSFFRLYEEQDVEAFCDTKVWAAVGGDFPEGRRVLRPEEKRDPKRNIAEGTELWFIENLTSQGPVGEGKDQGQPFVWQGTQFGPDGLTKRHWSVDQLGLEALSQQDRLFATVPSAQRTASAGELHWRCLRSEVPGKRLNNVWETKIAPTDRRYPVQTGDLAIQRCILMTTRPGDLVLDPTVGSGTTPVVAEEWGRRWIGIDTSREALAVSRERILVQAYTQHLLIGSLAGFRKENELRAAVGQPALTAQPRGDRDPAGGIVVERVPYVSAATLAYKDRPDKPSKREWTWLVDRPVGAKPGKRVASRFTVETEYLDEYRSPEELLTPRETARQLSWREHILQMLDEKGIGSNEGTRWMIEALESVVAQAGDDNQAGRITHRCRLIDHATGKKLDAVIAIWPQDSRVGTDSIQRNVREAISRHQRENQLALIVVGAEIDGGSYQALDGGEYQIPVARIEAGAELHLREVRRRVSDLESPLLLVAEPTVEVEQLDEDQHRVHVRGWHEYNPVTGQASFMTPDTVRMWLLDTDYNGSEFCARRIHLSPDLRLEENRAVLEKILGRDGDRDAVKALFGNVSEPFSTPTNAAREVAVRLIIGNGSVLTWRGPVL